MAEVVDSIIAEVILRGVTQYEEGFARMKRAHDGALPSLKAIGDQSVKIEQAAQRYKRGADTIASAEEQTGKRITRSKKSTTDTSIAEDQRSTASAARAARTKADTEIAEAERSARSRARINSATYGPPRPINIIESGTGRPQLFGLGEPRQAVSDRPLPIGRSTAAADAKAAATAEEQVNRALVDQIGLQGRLTAARGEDRQIIQDELFQIQQLNRYIAAGVTEAEAMAKVEQDLLAIETLRTRNAEAKAAADAAALEKQIAAQAAQVRQGVSLFTGALVGGLTLAELQHLTDKYTEFSNSLRVAGVDAASFAEVQERLLTVANRNGTSLNALGDVYRSLSLASHDVGATQEQQLKVTEAASNALRIQGVSSERARGALLQLGHAFETGRVNAREFNSLALNLYPLLQAAARGSDQFGGSVAKLRAAIVAGTVSSKDFFDFILAGADTLQGPASKATLTLAQGFTSLTNALEVYVGSANQANGVSAAFGEGLKAIGNNLNTLIPAISVVGTALTTGYIVRMVSAIETTAQFRAAVLSAFGGPVGIALSALAVTFGYVALKINEARAEAELLDQSIQAQIAKFAVVRDAHARVAAETDNLTKAQRTALTATANLTGEADKLASAWGRVAAQAKAAAIAQAQADLDIANSNVRKARQALDDKNAGAVSFVRATSAGLYGVGGMSLESGSQIARETNGPARQTLAAAQSAQRDARTALDDVKARTLSTYRDTPANPNEAAINKLQAKIDGLQRIASEQSGKDRQRTEAKITKAQEQLGYLQQGINPAAAAAGSYAPRVGSGRTRQEHTLEQKQNDFEAKQAELQRQQLDANAALSQTADDRAKAENARLDAERAAYVKQVTNDKDLDKDKRKALLATQANVIETTRQRIERDRLNQISEDDFRLADDQRAADIDALQAKLSLAKTIKARRDLEEQILQAQEDREVARLDHQIDVGTAAQKDQALADLRRVPGQRADKEAQLSQQYKSPLARYRDSLEDPKAQVEDAIANKFRSVDDAITAGAAKVLGVKDNFLKSLIQIFLEQNVLKPLYDSFAKSALGGVAGGGGIITSVLGLFGISGARAAGGPVAAGMTYLVGEKGPELVKMAGNGHVYPNGTGPNVAAANQRVSSPVQASLTQSKPQIVVVEVDKAPLFDVHVRNAAAPLAQAAVVGGSQLAQQESAEAASQRIP